MSTNVNSKQIQIRSSGGCRKWVFYANGQKSAALSLPLFLSLPFRFSFPPHKHSSSLLYRFGFCALWIDDRPSSYLIPTSNMYMDTGSRGNRRNIFRLTNERHSIHSSDRRLLVSSSWVRGEGFGQILDNAEFSFSTSLCERARATPCARFWNIEIIENRFVLFLESIK